MNHAQERAKRFEEFAIEPLAVVCELKALTGVMVQAEEERYSEI